MVPKHLLLLLTMYSLFAENSYTIACQANCMACNNSDGTCYSLSCNYQYSRQASGICQIAQSNGPSANDTTALINDNKTNFNDANTVGNCEGFSRIDTSGGTKKCSDSSTQSISTDCNTACSAAGCINILGTEYCYACKSVWKTTATLAGANQRLWIQASDCSGGSVTAPLTTDENCQEFAYQNYCVLCKLGYISVFDGTNAKCVARSTNPFYMMSNKLLYCIMAQVTSSNDVICLSCDIFKNITMTNTNPLDGNVCNDPNEYDRAIIAKNSLVLSSTTKSFKWVMTKTDAQWLPIPTVYIAAERLIAINGSYLAPVIGQFVDEGGDIYCQVTASWTGRESYEIGAQRPYVSGTMASAGVLRIYVFNYAGCVPESFSAVRSPDHAFGEGKAITTGDTTITLCESFNGIQCNGQAVYLSCKWVIKKIQL